MSVTTSNFQHPTLKWREKGDPGNLMMAGNSNSNEAAEVVSSNVDDGLTSLSWLQNLNMCMTRLGAPTPPTPPASPLCFGLQQQLQQHHQQEALPKQQQPNRRSSTNSGAAVVQVEGTSGSHRHEGSSSECALLMGPQCQVAAAAAAAAASIAAQSSGKPKVEPRGKKRSSSSQGNRPSGSSSRSKKAAIGVTGSVAVSAAPSTTTTATTTSAAVSSRLFSVNVTPQEESTTNQQQSSETASVVEEEVDYKVDGSIKPPYSYATLICMAMKANRNKMTLSSIYKWIKENFLYYRNADPSWQVWFIEQHSHTAVYPYLLFPFLSLSLSLITSIGNVEFRSAAQRWHWFREAFLFSSQGAI